MLLLLGTGVVDVYSKTMFRRRNQPKLHHRARDFLWPSLGWRRSTVYLFHRVGRIPGSSYSIACGFACGAAVSFTPFVGLHFILGALCALLMRGNVLASAIGTAVGNPWSFPFIWAWIYHLGLWMTGQGGDAEKQDFGSMFAAMMDASLKFDIAYLLETVWPVWWPMLLGSIPSFIIVWFLFFLPLRPLIGGYQDKRRERRMRKIVQEKQLEETST